MVEKKTPVGKPADDFIRIQDLWSMFVPQMVLVRHLPVHYPDYSGVVPAEYSPYLHPYRCHSRQGQLESSSSTSAMNDFFRFGYLQVQYQHQQRVANIKVAHTDDRGSQPTGIERNLYHPQGIKERRFVKVSPVTITFCDKIEVPLSFTIKFSSKEAFAISELEISGRRHRRNTPAQMGDSIQTSAGS